MNNYVIVLPTHSKYIKVVENFISLLRKNWPDCPYKIIISITGEETSINDYECIYNGKNASLIDCVVNVSKKYKYDYYICFLGDAFINKRVDNDIIASIFNQVIENHIDYCCLNYVKKYKKEKRMSNELRYINSFDRYSHSFVAFVGSYMYIQNDFSKFKSDLDFEKNYLNIEDKYYFEKHVIVRKNYFNILPCVIKGQYDRINYNKIKKNNSDICFAKIEVTSWYKSFCLHIRNNIIYFFPRTIIKIIKKIMNK